MKKIGTFNARRKAPTTSIFAQWGLGVVVIKPYVFEFLSMSIGPNEPIAKPARLSNLEKNSIHLSRVSIGVVVGNCVFSMTLLFSSPTAQTNFVPPASRLPYNLVISILFFNSLFFYYIIKENGSLLFLIEKTTLIYVSTLGEKLFYSKPHLQTKFKDWRIP